MRNYCRVPIVLLVVGLLASLWTAGRRLGVENASRTVELTIDLEQLRSQALSAGVPLGEALESLKRVGITSVALTEQVLGELEADGLAEVRQQGRGTRPGVTVVRLEDPTLYRQVAESLQLRLRSARTERQDREQGRRSGGEERHPRQVRLRGPDGQELVIPAGWSTVRSVSAGFAPSDLALVRKHGLELVARLGNIAAADPSVITAAAEQLHQAGVRTVIFAGDEVLGHRRRLKETAAALDAQGLRYGSVEFGKQLGDEGLSRALNGRIVRVHSVQPVEMARMGPQAVADRYVKAAEERNIRLLYLRLFAEEPFAENVAFVEKVARRLRAGGLRPGPAEPFGRIYSIPEAGQGSAAATLAARLIPALSGLAVAGGAVLLLATLVRLPFGLQALLALLGGGAASLMVLVGGDPGRKLVALAGAMLFPVLAFVWFPAAAEGRRPPVNGEGEEEGNGRRAPREYPSSSARRRSRPPDPLLTFAAICAVTLMGALTVVGLLSERPFMVKASAFAGIKAAHFLPLLAIAGLIIIGGFGGPLPWPELRQRARQNLALFFGERLHVWHLATGFLALVVLGLMLARTGNDPGVGITTPEMALRSLLDRFMVRPRTKEFLIGHPVLVATLVLAARGAGRPWLLPLLLVGAIGQVSMVNSFCHLHTPLMLTAARTFNGLWLGLLLGLALAWLAGRWARREQRGSRPLETPSEHPLTRSSASSSR